MCAKRGNALVAISVAAMLLAAMAFGALTVGAAAPRGTAEITAPQADAQVSGNVAIQGTAIATSFQFYKLEFGSGANPSQWSVIGELHKTQVSGGVLGTWNTAGLANGPYTLRLTVVDNTGNWLETSRAVTIGPATEGGPPEEMPRRGCLACHVLVPPEAGLPEGAFTLAFEAIAAAPNHPTVSPSGVSLQPTDQTGPQPCLECHRPGSGARADVGVMAPINLRDIVHPAHLFSQVFVPEFRGNCFSCHNVTGTGAFVVLGEAVEVDESGVPQRLPIPGAFSVSVGR